MNPGCSITLLTELSRLCTSSQLLLLFIEFVFVIYWYSFVLFMGYGNPLEQIILPRQQDVLLKL
jgi:hypothetical protein